MKEIQIKLITIFILLFFYSFPIYLNGQVDTTKVVPQMPAYPWDSMRMNQPDTAWRFPDSLLTRPMATDSSLLSDSLLVEVIDEPVPDTRPHWQKLLFTGKRPPFEPKIAAQRSMIFPGWGQMYNKRYWKLPIVYGGYAALGYWYNLQNSVYQDFRVRYLYRVDNDPNTNDTQSPNATDDGVRQARDRARKQRDYAVLYIIGFHVFQVLEAFVDAHLKNFDVSEDLSMNTRPGMLELRMPGSSQYYPGISLSVAF